MSRDFNIESWSLFTVMASNDRRDTHPMADGAPPVSRIAHPITELNQKLKPGKWATHDEWNKENLKATSSYLNCECCWFQHSNKSIADEPGNCEGSLKGHEVGHAPFMLTVSGVWPKFLCRAPSDDQARKCYQFPQTHHKGHTRRIYKSNRKVVQISHCGKWSLRGPRRLKCCR